MNTKTIAKIIDKNAKGRDHRYHVALEPVHFKDQ